MYFIFFQDFDDIDHFSAETIEEINTFMDTHSIARDGVFLVKGEMVSNIDNKHWPAK